MEKRKPERRDRTAAPRPAAGGRKRAVLGAIQKNRDKRDCHICLIWSDIASTGMPAGGRSVFSPSQPLQTRQKGRRGDGRQRWTDWRGVRDLVDKNAGQPGDEIPQDTSAANQIPIHQQNRRHRREDG